MKRKTILIAITSVLALGLALAVFFIVRENAVYSGEDFGIERLISERDENKNGIDDYTDLLEGARAYVATEPTYISVYYSDGDGYPPIGEGVCTDVIWSAFSNAGYDLRALVNYDISASPEAYTDQPDPNIDFRRVKNLKVFFDRHAESLTLDPKKTEEWQPGDIVTFSPSHIAIISDKRNYRGEPYIIHHGGGYVYEENALSYGEITGHYRWHGWTPY